MAKMKKILLSFLLILTLICNCPCITYASGSLSGWDTWTTEQKATWWTANIAQIVGSSIGLFIPNNQVDIFTAVCSSMYDEMMKDTSYESYNDWLSRHLGYNSETQEVSMDDELTDFVYNASVQYIEEETGYYIHRTADISKVLSMHLDLFAKKTQYDYFLDFVKNNDDCYFFFEKIKIVNYSVDSTLGTGKNALLFYQVKKNDIDFVASKQSYGQKRLSFYDKNWNSKLVNSFIIDEDSNIIPYSSERSYFDGFFLTGKLSYVNTAGTVKQYVVYPYEYASYPSSIDGYNVTYNSFTSWPFMASVGSEEIRVYKTLSDLKQYSFNQRPYYVTETFTNYDSTIDNSTTITQTEIDNSVTYGDVYNYITNNYENPDGLSEDELRAILAEYLSSINNSGGSGGSGSGSGDSGGSGGGLSGFLDGLGSLGDALLAIIGKLLEYVGKAIELLSGTVTKVIDLVPQNITNLISGLFPFIPQEWLVAIELSLVLAVVIGIVGIFKK